VPSREPNAAGEHTRERLLDAAERLIAVQGAAVPLRQIALAAGQRNNSAISYHFGSRDALVDAVWDRRTRRVDVERAATMAELVAAGRSDDPRALMQAYVMPLAHEIGRLRPSYWARFNEVTLASKPLVFLDELDEDLATYPETDVPLRTLAQLFHLMRRSVATAGPPAELQVALMVRFVITALAAWERDQERGITSPCSLSDFAQSLVEIGELMLGRPSSRER
jgi:AcrR family transcriptional regulator